MLQCRPKHRHPFPHDGLITSVIWPDHHPSLIHTLTNQLPYIRKIIFLCGCGLMSPKTSLPSWLSESHRVGMSSIRHEYYMFQPSNSPLSKSTYIWNVINYELLVMLYSTSSTGEVLYRFQYQIIWK